MGLGQELQQSQTGTQYQTAKGTATNQQQSQNVSASQQGQQGTQAGTQNTQNQYTGAQQAAQNQANQMLSTVMQTGQLPPGWGLNQAAIQAATDNFKNNIEPTLAAQYGAGSPQIGSQFALMNEQLIGNLSQQEFQNFQGIFGDVANIAYRPIGTASQSTGTQSSSGTASGTNVDTSTGSATSNQNTATSNNLVGALLGQGYTGLFTPGAGGIFGSPGGGAGAGAGTIRNIMPIGGA
jgi:hypothetical protein